MCSLVKSDATEPFIPGTRNTSNSRRRETTKSRRLPEVTWEAHGSHQVEASNVVTFLLIHSRRSL